MKKQIIVIHGGDSFETYEEFLEVLKNWEVSRESFLPKSDWKSCLADRLGESFEVLSPRMPNKQNAKYEAWKIWFERMLPFIENGVILIGHSLGSLFLVKYLSENIFPKKVSALFLVAACYNRTGDIYTFELATDLEKVWAQCRNIHIFHSEDDPVVAASEVGEFKKAWPGATIHMFSDRGHFNQGDFPEIIEEIKRVEK